MENPPPILDYVIGGRKFEKEEEKKEKIWRKKKRDEKGDI